MTTRNFFRHAAAFCFLFGVSASVALAQPTTPTPAPSTTKVPNTGGLYGLRDPLGNVRLEAEVGRVVRYAIGFSGALFLAYFIYGGFLWLTARGDSHNVEKAQDALRNAILGMAVIVLSYTIISFILGFTVTITGGTN